MNETGPAMSFPGDDEFVAGIRGFPFGEGEVQRDAHVIFRIGNEAVLMTPTQARGLAIAAIEESFRADGRKVPRSPETLPIADLGTAVFKLQDGRCFQIGEVDCGSDW